jgi:uncharacterized MAPEG superfamily protein
MTTAYTCVLIALLLPYVWMYLSKKSLISARKYDNHSPRLLITSLKGAEQRAYWAQENAYESLPGFIAAVIIAHLAGAPQLWVDTLAVVHIVARVMHGVCYMADLATMRSLVWTIGLFAVIGLFIISY